LEEKAWYLSSELGINEQYSMNIVRQNKDLTY